MRSVSKQLTPVDDKVNAVERGAGATVLADRVSDPEHYCMVVFDMQNRIISIEGNTKSHTHYAVTGVCLFNCRMVENVACNKSSPRGE